ncbi:GNAT family N-acetyltransferase [Kamptonema cortianum]|nr:GNAT family N-acetyltransferase [Geitlerinema splendidum]MDK3162477.1 GNAT family N-acetyltransferase [Kamptonema cortianum]
MAEVEYVRWESASHPVQEITRLVHSAYKRLGDMGLNFTAVDQDDDTTRYRLSKGSSFLAVQGGTIVGTITLVRPGQEDIHPWLARDDVAHFTQFAVEPHLQGSGIGRQLLRLAEEEAARIGAKHIALDTAVPAAHLVEMYAEWGYVEVGLCQWPGKRYQSVVMSKELPGIRCNRTE